MKSCMDAVELAALAQLSDAAQPWVQPELTGRALFQRLQAAQLRTDALKVLPHLLDKQAAVWWGCLCVCQAERSFVNEAALGAAVHWVYDPCETTRRLAGKVAEPAGGLQTPSGCLALAAFWSGGSMTPPELPTVAPPPYLTAKVVAGAVLLAGSRHALHHGEEIQQHFLDLGRDVAKGRLPWSSREPVARRAASPVASQARKMVLTLVGAEESR
jgi:hypothetical protein